MSVSVTCPSCGQQVEQDAWKCPRCGIDLALASVLAEDRAFAYSNEVSNGVMIAPEILVPRLGDILLEKKLIQPVDLESALSYSAQLASQNRPQLLGQILLDRHLIDRETLDLVITEQIFKLQAALHQSNQQLELRVKERTNDLQTALAKLSELSQLKSNFISNISHELRTPLTHIKGYLDLFADESLGSLTVAQKNAMDVLLRAEGRLEQLIDDLIRFTLAERGEFTLHLGNFTIAELIKPGIERSARAAQNREISIDIIIPDGLPSVKADDEKISWVILQLLDNAIKFTPKGGRVLIAAEPENDLVIFSVTDTGIGIPKERFGELFEPFHQLDSSERRKYGGTGLGLALVNKIIDAHGSTIRIKSEVGVGTRFEFSLVRAG
jgi:signal transduction histidine kinase